MHHSVFVTSTPMSCVQRSSDYGRLEWLDELQSSRNYQCGWQARRKLSLAIAIGTSAIQWESHSTSTVQARYENVTTNNDEFCRNRERSKISYSMSTLPFEVGVLDVNKTYFIGYDTGSIDNSITLTW